MDDAAPEPLAEAAIEDLRERLARTRLVPVPGTGWSRGTDPAYLAALLEDWARFDHRRAEARIRALPWTRAGGLRLLHRRGPTGAPAVVLLHGWPDSVLRFERVLPLLDDLTVVVPAFPGYPFSGSAGAAGAAMAAPIAAALAELGVRRCTVSGGDVGTGVAVALARSHPELVGSIHLTDVPDHLASVPEAERTPAERAYAAAALDWELTEGGYEVEQSTRPSTLAVGLGDSPAGLAAWIVEKLRAWSDCGGDLESVFPRDDVLTWVSAYWFTAAIGTAFASYSEWRPTPMTPVRAPAVVQAFPADIVAPPREHAERYLDVREWIEEPSGGHFAAWERPEAFAAGLRRAVALA